MKKIILSILMISISMVGFGETWTISSVGNSFNPSSITVSINDDISFVLGFDHNAVPVSEANWNSNGSTALPGGFQIPFGGGSIQASQLGVGTHYYICTAHASFGMKGIIIVESTTNVETGRIFSDLTLFPNPAADYITLKTSSDLNGHTLVISDIIGAKVMSKHLINDDISMDVGSLEPGIYFIQFEGIKRKTLKFIKK
jgi:plastocyanin